MLSVAGGVLALVAAWWAPGAAAVRWLGLGRDRLERWVLAWAIGQVLFAVFALAAVSTVGAAWIPAWAAVGALAWFAAPRPAATPQEPGRDLWLPVGVAVGATALLVFAVVARSGIADPSGTLYFFGRDSTNDPLVYAALALQLHETGLPLHYPFAGGATTTSSYLPYGLMVGLHGFGVPMLDVVFRWLPLASCFGLSLAAAALVRRFGGGPVAAASGAALVLLGGDPGGWIAPVAGLFGIGAQGLDSWALFGPYLLAFNPGASAMGLALAAWLLMASPGQGRGGPWLAGVLVAATFEAKVFVWAPLLLGLAGVAWLWPPAGLAAALRRASLVSALASAPLLIEKLAWARAFQGRDVTGFELCPGCLPRYLADAALGSGRLGFEAFTEFAWGRVLDPAWLVGTLAAALLMLLILLGARALALPLLIRGAGSQTRASDPGLVGVHRWIGAAAILGIGAAMSVTTAPHYLNGAQFAWIATVGLWPIAVVAVARMPASRRRAAGLLLVGLSLPGSWHAGVRLGLEAPVAARVAPGELALLDGLRASSAPGDVVLEPSVLANADFPSPVAWWAGRSVRLSLLSASQILPEAEVYARQARISEVFTTRDSSRGLAAIRESGAGWVYATSAWPLRFPAGPGLEVVRASAAGTVYRVRGGAE